VQYTARGLAFTTTADAGPGTRRTELPIPPSHHGHDLERWPLHSTLTLEAIEGSVPSARAHLRQLLCEWGHAAVSQDAGAVVTELVANAVVASAGLGPAVASVLVRLGSDSRCLLLGIADASPRPPVRLTLGPDAEGGRGLALVEAFSSRWGWHLASTAGLVKVVWAEWRLPAEAGQRPSTSLTGRCYAA
jgi:anti-sigma regulatory factor (Ser/Thr protein kinase)